MTAIEKFLQDHYTDEKLAALLAHAQDGKLAYWSCCCLIGIPTADHALRSDFAPGRAQNSHIAEARYLVGSTQAEFEFAMLGDNDAERREKLIPMILAEMARRASLSVSVPESKGVKVVESVESVTISISNRNGVAK